MAAHLVVRPSGRPLGISARWLVGLGAVVTLLGLLAYAEIVWLHEALPQDRVSRVALAAFPAEAGEAPRAPLPPDWDRRLAREAMDAELLSALGAHLAPGKLPASPLSVEQVRERIALTTQCIERPSAGGSRARGVLLVSTFRGEAAAEVEALGRAWASLVAEAAAARYPGIRVVPLDSLGTAYELCRA